LPQLKKSGGAIVNIGAISACLTAPSYGPIAASKSAAASLNDAMRVEFAQFGVNVILIEPRAMKTDIFSTSRAARDANLSASPEQERHDRPALIAMDRAFKKAGADDPGGVVGKGTEALLILSRLSVHSRDKLVKSALGLTAALKPKAVMKSV
jgi:NAD(P)-dependent dehydrogenase (short-subunit alcohol dehydrogenase family)